MRVLYVISRFPFPLTSGVLRHYHFVRELSKRHELTLVSIVDDTFEPGHLDALRPFCERIVTVPRPEPGRLDGMLHTDAGLLLGSEPALVALNRRLSQLLEESSFDVALLAGKRVVRSLRVLAPTPAVLDLCDVESVRLGGRLRHASWHEKPRMALGWALMRGAETWAARWPLGAVVVASVRDRDSLRVPGVEPAVIPNGVDLDYWDRSARSLGERTIVFTGAMHYAPNADAAQQLIEQVLPRVRERVPEAELLIVGRDPSAALKRCGKRGGAAVTGFVDDMRPYLDRATVFAAPIRFSAGIQNKLLEALAMQLPVVASSPAADGLRTLNRDHPPIEAANGVEELSSALVRRLLSEDRRPDGALRSFVERHFGWEQNALRLDELLSMAASRPVSRRVTSLPAGELTL